MSPTSKHDQSRGQASESRISETHERRQSLWILTASPLIWATHFMASYLTAAIWCAKAESRAVPLGDVRTAIGIYTAIALAGIASVTWAGVRKHTFGRARLPHDADLPEDRHRFLGFATILLSGLSAVATIFVSLAAVFTETCY